MSLVAVVCFLPGRAKDLSAPPRKCVPETTNKEGFHLRLAVDTIQQGGIRRLLVAGALYHQGSSCRSSDGLVGQGQVSPRTTGPSQLSMMQLETGPLVDEVPTQAPAQGNIFWRVRSAYVPGCKIREFFRKNSWYFNLLVPELFF